ncbi:MAG: alpha/beta fold hydrolase [Oligoflexales bacterium]
MAILKREAVNLNYDVTGGSGPWVSLINGYTRPGSDFRMLAKHIANAGFRVLTFDNRGAGKTEYFSPFTLEDMASDVRELWLALGVKRSHVLGISMGGIIAQILAEADPLDSLTLISSTASKEFLAVDRGWPDNLEGIENKLIKYFDLEFYKRNKLLVTMMAKNIRKEISNQNFLERAQAQSQAILSYRWDVQCPDHLPILVIHGENDRIIPLQAAYDLQNRYPNVSLQTLSNCGHLLLAENLKGIIHYLLDFWS